MRQRLAAKQAGRGTVQPPRTSVSTIRRANFQAQTNSKEERVYRGWLNWKLANSTPPVSVRNLAADLSDGVVLVLLAQVLYGNKLKYNKRAVLVPQKIDNVNVALMEFKKQGLIHNAESKGFVDMDLHTVLGFLWMLIQHDQKMRAAAGKGADLKKDIYDWVTDYISAYPGAPKDIRSLGPAAFKDGRVLNFMVHKADPNTVDLEALEMTDAKTRLLDALKLAKTDLGVPNLITADTMLEDKVHEPSLLTYLFAFRDTVEKGKAGSRKDAKKTPQRPRPTKKEGTDSRGKFNTVRGNPKNKQRAGFETLRAGPEHAHMDCSICLKKLSGELVKVLPQGTLYHNACFVCQTCTKTFDRYYWPYQSKPYCFDHYIEAAGLVCSSCNKQIRENAVVARGKKYHSECWCCTDCGIQFADSFFMFEGKPYCNPHYQERAGASCANCGLDITEKAVKALNAHWHRECFQCKTCGTAILQPDGSALQFFAQDGAPVCVDCHDAAMAYSRNECPKCKQVPKKDIVSAMGSKWHSSCFVCTGCTEPFTSSFFNVDGSPYCEKCARNL